MAGGKLSARQKMINLMYLVFIAMMAMQMSKEVLSAFSLMNDKFVDSNEMATNSNNFLKAGLEQKAKDQPQKFTVVSGMAQRISKISDDFYAYLEGQKNMILEDGGFKEEYMETGKLPAQAMEKGDFLDEKWFVGDKKKPEGQAFVDRIEKYKNDIKAVLGKDESYNKAKEDFDKRFDLSEVTNNEGKKLDWLTYHVQGYPAISTYTKITAMQNDVKATEANMYNLFLGNSLEEEISLKNYTAIVIPEKNAFFSGEKFKGRVVIGKYANVTPTKLTLGSREVDLSKDGVIDSTGSANIEFTVGGVGEHDLKGQFTFLEKGEDINIDYEGKYVVVPRPNSATISADKMNVVYRGVVNPMTISFAGVANNKVVANATGLKKLPNGKYEMRPAGGREVTINVTATLDDGSRVSDKKTFRIKDLPKPFGAINGQTGNAKLPKNNVEIGRLSATFGDDFDFKLPLSVTSFTMKVPGKPSVNVTGNRLNGAAKNALRTARRGDLVQFINIRVKPQGSGVAVKPASPVVVELSN